ncbi:bifunctional RNase H/acid phosphatase [Streptomyces seoulensis]|uniref:bifunctional RNase H/acid phosphatase n=1 Tax=Streptomyces seoulensis TaxID=73044 RepID=UPI001FCBC91A|nr:bifunctional RNase H/acid phosphatase [Streptomyces seoulensis]BDH04053.1 bifunctional RNase H/acid phosphatase [Streptomyces seoulensis]
MREFVVEADGGSRGNPGPAGYGAAVSDAATGETLAEAAEFIGVATNNVAEYRGLLAGLRAAHALDPEARVAVRMDSKLVVEQMSGRWKIKHPDMKPLATEARRIFPPGRVTYEWIPRERNKHADRLANEAMDAGAKGEAWTPRLPAPVAPAPEGPPGDARAGAAAARAALAQRRGAPSAGEGDSGPHLAAPGTGEPGDAAGSAADASVPQAAAADDRVPTGAEPASGASAGRHRADARAARTVASATTSAPGWSAAPDLGAPATFVLLRHGETPLTPQKRFSGSGGSDPALSEAGREQARLVAAALARRGTVQAVVASPLARTRETAGVVADRLGLDVSVDDGLRETDFGAWEGLTFGEVRERYPDDLNAWLGDPEACPTGGGESFARTAERIEEARARLVAAYAGRTVLLVTHVTPIKTLLRLALGAPPESLFRMELSAASLSAVAYYADGNASVRLFNDTSHLRP